MVLANIKRLQAKVRQAQPVVFKCRLWDVEKAHGLHVGFAVLIVKRAGRPVQWLAAALFH